MAYLELEFLLPASIEVDDPHFNLDCWRVCIQIFFFYFILFLHFTSFYLLKDVRKGVWFLGDVRNYFLNLNEPW